MSEDMMPQRSDLVGKYDSYISENKKLRAEIENLRDRLYLASIKVADARVEANKLRARVEVLERACRLIEGDPDPHAVAECIGCYRHSRLAYHALEAKP